MKQVSRALVGDRATKIRLTNLSQQSVVSPLAPHKQANDSLISENMAKTISHEDQSLESPELKSTVGGQPKGSTKAKKKQDYLPNLNAPMQLFLNTPENTMLLNLLEEGGIWVLEKAD